MGLPCHLRGHGRTFPGQTALAGGRCCAPGGPLYQRRNMPMNIRSSHPDKGRTPAVEREIERVVSIWETCRSRYGAGGELLFGGFTCADAMFVPVVSRFKTYSVKLPSVAQRYADTVLNLESVK